ncbi:MAG: DUF523 domain-containing protein [Desulfobulbaceae bacterium]|nr:DUF523 domain-containing protein [Desulfobulbaceae bacterium]
MQQPESPKKYLVSACLVGLCTRYDAGSNKSAACLELVKESTWIPVCPEQLGGLPTPRNAADLVGGDGNDVLAGRARVVTRSGVDVTCQFVHGARQCLAVALAQNIATALLKAKSPSCGLSPRPGVTAALLQQHGIKVIEF